MKLKKKPTLFPMALIQTFHSVFASSSLLQAQFNRLIHTPLIRKGTLCLNKATFLSLSETQRSEILEKGILKVNAEGKSLIRDYPYPVYASKVLSHEHAPSILLTDKDEEALEFLSVAKGLAVLLYQKDQWIRAELEEAEAVPEPPKETPSEAPKAAPAPKEKKSKSEPPKEAPISADDLPERSRFERTDIYPYYGGKVVSRPADVRLEGEEPNVGESLRLGSSGEEIQLKELLKEGGEGGVYRTSDPALVAKIYFSNSDRDSHTRTKERQEKIEQMCKKPILDPHVIWPLAPLYDSRKRFVGYVMKCCEGVDLKRVYFPAKRNPPPFDYSSFTRVELVKLALSICTTLSCLHDRNVVVGDIKFDNFLLCGDNKTEAYFVDCDSYQVDRFPCHVGSDGFLSPEAILRNHGAGGDRLDYTYRTMDDDNFALFCLLFGLFAKGTRPYAQTYSGSGDMPSESEYAAKGKFPYSLKKEETESHQIAGGSWGTVNWSHLPSYLKKAFIDVGSVSLRDKGLLKRKTPEEWIPILSMYLEDLESGLLASLDPDAEKGILSPDQPAIDYEKVAFDDLRELKTEDLSILSALRKGLSAMKMRVDPEVVAKSLAKEKVYESDSLKAELLAYIGCYAEVHLKRKGR